MWVRKGGQTRVPRTWAVPAPDAIDVPWEGRERTSIDDEALPVECAEDGDDLVLTCGDVRVRVASSPLRMTFQRRIVDAWVTVLADRPTGAHLVGSDAVDLPTLTAPEGTDVAHMVLQVPGGRIVGLGEKAGPLDRSGRRYEMRALDAMGYDASRTDPLYKHWPMWIRTVPGATSDPGRSDSPDATSAPASTSPGAVGVFYDNHSRCVIDLGLARDNYHAEFSSWHADSHLDFTNPATLRWRRRQVRTQLLELGIETTWNDNNEFEVWDENAVCDGFGEPVRLGDIRPVQTLLMARASHEEQRGHRPERRPYVISRSGMPGMQRYAQTWSGDNDCSWETLRDNTVMGVGMSLSGMYDIGHDVGGFTGTRPSPELFVRCRTGRCIRGSRFIRGIRTGRSTNRGCTPRCCLRCATRSSCGIGLCRTCTRCVFSRRSRTSRSCGRRSRSTNQTHDSGRRTPAFSSGRRC